MAETFVIPDLHGNRKLAVGLMKQEGLIEDIDSPRRLRPEVTVLQLGDLCNCVFGSINDDLYALKLVEHGIIDYMLVGNHEHPYFGGTPFSGFGWFAELKSALVKLNDRGRIRAAREVDGILLTHAGVTADIDQVDKWYGDEGNKARQVAEGLNILWDRRDYTHGMFSAISFYRGGTSKLGSILWSDWREEKSHLFPQIFGHTVGETFRVEYLSSTIEYPDNDAPSFILQLPQSDLDPIEVRTLCLDVGAGKHSSKILGCWIKGGGVRLVEYEY